MSLITPTDLSQRLRDDLGWRRKEIEVYSDLVRRAKHRDKQACLRGAVAVLYAHWEGFTKAACQTYVDFVRSHKLPNSQLSDSFLAMAAKNRINVLVSSKASAAHIDFVSWCRAEWHKRAHLPTRSVISTESNLSVAVFRNLCWQLGLVYRPEYALLEKPVFERLLALRNQLAHGEWVVIGESEWSQQLQPKIVSAMQLLCDEIEDAAYTARHHQPLRVSTP